MRHAIMAGHAVHGDQLFPGDRGRIEAGLQVHVFGGRPIVVIHPHIRDALVQVVKRVVFDFIGNVPVDASSQPLPLGAAAGFHDQIGLARRIGRIIPKARDDPQAVIRERFRLMAGLTCITCRP